VCTENLSSGVAVVKSAQDGARTHQPRSLNQARNWRIFVQGSMRSEDIVVVGVGFQDLAQMHLAQDNDVVRTFTPDRSDQSFGKATLPRRGWCGRLVRVPMARNMKAHGKLERCRFDRTNMAKRRQRTSGTNQLSSLGTLHCRNRHTTPTWLSLRATSA